MDYDDQLEKAAALLAEAAQLKAEATDLINHVTRETFFVKAGDVIVLEQKQRKNLLGNVYTTEFRYLVVNVMAYDDTMYRPNKAVLAVHRVDAETGTVDRTKIERICYANVRTIRVIGHADVDAVAVKLEEKPQNGDEA